MSNVTIGININCKSQDFIEQILNGEKIIETRDNKSLVPYLGKRVGLIKTGCGKATLCGYITLETYTFKVVDSIIFDMFYNGHKVAKDSEYYIKDNGVKYMYQLLYPERCEPKIINTKGVVARRIDV